MPLPIRRWVLISGLLLVMIQQVIFNTCFFFFGWKSSMEPLDIPDSSKIYINRQTQSSSSSSSLSLSSFPTKSEYKKLSIRLTEERRSKKKKRSSITVFDDINNKTHLKPTWHIYEELADNNNISIEDVNVNTCFHKNNYYFGLPAVSSTTTAGSSSFACLPAFYIVGFEKCGTTALNIWLSYHPNLKTNWIEGRYFDQHNLTLNLNTSWQYEYLPSLPTIDEDTELGKVWTFEKSPAYSSNPKAAKAMSELVPDAKILFLTRNPTHRAYSMFIMYTHHYVDITQALLFQQPVSFFIKNSRNQEVHYLNKPGIGGTIVNPKYIPVNAENDTWTYLKYPPSPDDFHNFVERMINYYATEISKSQHKDDTNAFNSGMMEQVAIQSRGYRVLTGGLYGEIIEKIWLPEFDSHQLVLIPSEQFFDDTNVLTNIKTLQQLLGIPLFDYKDIASNITGRMEISSSLGTILNKKFNNNAAKNNNNQKGDNSNNVLPMNPETKKLLDKFYCESNRKLHKLINGLGGDDDTRGRRHFAVAGTAGVGVDRGYFRYGGDHGIHPSSANTRSLPKGYSCGGDDGND